MTTRSDYDPEHSVEAAREPGTRQPVKHVWALRTGGVVLVVLAWALASAHSLTAEHMLLNAVAFVGLALYALVAGSAGRRLSVNMEKKLRLDLLVHNIELENMATRDGLTRLFNRQYFFDRLERELETARGSRRPLSVLLIDIDQLKAVNDTYGHRTGDEILKKFGNFLLGQTRASDVPARLGGDEFAIILPDTSESAAGVMAGRIQKALEDTDLIDEAELTLRLTAAVGASGYPWGGETADAIMMLADASMHTNKQARGQATMTAPEAAPSPTTGVPVVCRKTGGTADV